MNTTPPIAGRCPHGHDSVPSVKKFQCPFAKMGEVDGTIIHVQLTMDHEDMLKRVADAYRLFYTPGASYSSIRFVLPDLLKEAESFMDLWDALLAFQSLIIGCEVFERFRTYWTHDRADHHKGIPQRIVKNRIECAEAIEGFIELCEFGWDGTAHKVAQLIFVALRQRRQEDEKEGKSEGRGGAVFRLFRPGTEHVLMDISLMGSKVALEETNEYKHTDFSDDTFNIVTCPLYPPDFPRYSPQVEIAVTRQRDFIRQPKDVRINIRESANRILERHGVKIADDRTQWGGLWIPEYAHQSG